MIIISSASLLAAVLQYLYFRFTFYTPAGLTGALMLLFPSASIPLSVAVLVAHSGLNAKKKRVLVSVLHILSVLFPAASVFLFITVFRKKTATGRISWPGCVLMLFMFVLYVIFEKTLQNLPKDCRAVKALSDSSVSYMAAARLALTVSAISGAVKLMGFYDLQNIANIVIAVIISYCAVFLFVSAAVHLIKTENPSLAVPVPFFGSADISLSGYLEKNTGITVRSLFSIGLIKKLMPFMVCLTVLLLWLATGLQEIAPYEQGAVYRLGVLRNEFLKPGLNLTLPYPLDKTEKYETGTVKSLTIGYIGSPDTDVVWTEAHGGEEFKLLLGNGNQLVSVNLRIEYQITDLSAYLRYSAKPEQLLEAAAYELITSELVTTDLETLLSVDRRAFSEEFSSLLSERLSKDSDSIGAGSTGLSVLSVVLESIHPPVAVAGKYQELISAGIIAEKYRLEAEGYASRVLAEADNAKNTLVDAAIADKYTKIAEAEATVAEFMAGVEADKSYSSTYRRLKYLDAVSKAYGGSSLVIVGEGIDSSRIWLGYPKAN
ncbi:MAG: hypothetical protein MJ137_08285 [Clostridia bacterium]|nr:hypothetical protein [Clostridia bacterium]